MLTIEKASQITQKLDVASTGGQMDWNPESLIAKRIVKIRREIDLNLSVEPKLSSRNPKLLVLNKFMLKRPHDHSYASKVVITESPNSLSFIYGE